MVYGYRIGRKASGPGKQNGRRADCFSEASAYGVEKSISEMNE